MAQPKAKKKATKRAAPAASKKAAVKKVAPKKATSSKASAKKPAVKKVAGKTAAAKKSSAIKTPAAKKAPVKKTAVVKNAASSPKPVAKKISVASRLKSVVSKVKKAAKPSAAAKSAQKAATRKAASDQKTKAVPEKSAPKVPSANKKVGRRPLAAAASKSKTAVASSKPTQPPPSASKPVAPKPIIGNVGRTRPPRRTEEVEQMAGRLRAGHNDGSSVGPIPTEAQLRKAPECDYMNDGQLIFFKARLMQMRAEVLARELDVKERLHQREIFADPADRASAEEEHWLDLRLRERESLLLKKIDEALRRIRDKEYGYCEKTGESIGIARLLARPTATVCVDVKGQDERAESQYRDR